ncbi:MULTISPECIES: XRE family transcriptional regulator [Fusobacterium]|jgi:lexA repressor|uniref:helix-turn-helix domain-containing protein n=1 Tax=Fusobacterium TaxID=848 RepID=UPI0028D2E356|nr:XRE family transcriptional regulator [Fusobacterium pseudoperiodonticum]
MKNKLSRKKTPPTKQEIELANKLRTKRLENNLSLQDVAEKLGVSKVTISRYETLDITNIPSDKIEGMAKLYNTTPAYLMGWETKKEKENIDIKNIDTDFLMVPLYQSISAGYGASNVDFIEMIPVFGLKKNGTTYFAVKVKGDSMEPKIPNGSTIIIKKNIAVEVGEIGAFNLNDENFVKQKKLVKDRLILHSFNLAYEDKVVNEFDDFIEYGKVVKVMIDL